MKKTMALILVILAALLAWGVILLSDVGAEELWIDGQPYEWTPSPGPQVILPYQPGGEYAIEVDPFYAPLIQTAPPIQRIISVDNSRLVDLLNECLEFIEDGAKPYREPGAIYPGDITFGVVKCASPLSDAQDVIDQTDERLENAKRHKERLERETVLHGKLIKTIQTLKGESK